MLSIFARRFASTASKKVAVNIVKKVESETLGTARESVKSIAKRSSFLTPKVNEASDHTFTALDNALADAIEYGQSDREFYSKK